MLFIFVDVIYVNLTGIQLNRERSMLLWQGETSLAADCGFGLGGRSFLLTEGE